MRVTVTREAGAFTNTSVGYVVSGTVTGLTVHDVQPSSGAIFFLNGQRSADLLLTAINDDTPEDDEVFSISLFTNDFDASITSEAKSLLIRRNDAPLKFTQVGVLYPI